MGGEGTVKGIDPVMHARCSGPRSSGKVGKWWLSADWWRRAFATGSSQTWGNGSLHSRMSIAEPKWAGVQGQGSAHGAGAGHSQAGPQPGGKGGQRARTGNQRLLRVVPPLAPLAYWAWRLARH